MQANSQQSGQLPNLHEKGTTPGDGTSNTLGKNFYQLCLPSHAASPSYPGQGATGNYLTQFTYTIQPATSDQILTSSIQATKDTMLTQENPLTSIYTLPTGKQDSQMILWNMPSNCKIFLPVNNINLQGAPNNNGPNMSHCAFNSNSSLYMQQQNTSLVAGPNNSQQVKEKTMDTTSLNETRRNVNTISLHSQQQHANSLTNLPNDSSKTRTSLPSDLKYYPPTSYPPPSTCGQNIAAQRAVAVVTPLSPIGTAPVYVSDKSANMKMNVRSEQEVVWDPPNIPHALETNANLNNQKGEPNDPTSKHQRPKSAEPRLNDGLCHVGAKSPIWTDESTDQSRHTSLPKLKSVVAKQQISVPTQMQNDPSEKINNNCTFTDKKTAETETIPVIEWPIDRLHTLMAMIQQIENGHQKNVQKTDAGRDVLKLFWNGDFQKFYNAVQTGIYQNIMEEVYAYCLMKEPVILRQIKSDARSRVNKDFHVLKHNEEPPKMTYKSSWLNLNENVDDIEKECGYSWFNKSFQNAPDHEAQNSNGCTKEAQKVENKVPAEEPTLDNECLHESLFNRQSPSVTDADCSPTRDCLVAGQTNSQTNANSLKDMITVVKDLDKKDVQTEMASSDDKYSNNDVGAQSVLSPKSTSQSDCTNLTKLNVVAEQPHVMAEQCETSEMMEHNVIAASPDKHETSLLNTSPEIVKVQVEEQTSLAIFHEDSHCTYFSPVPFNAHSPTVIDNCSLKLNLVEEQTSRQPNTINPLNGMKNLVTTLKERDYFLRRHQKVFNKSSGLKRKHQNSSRILRLNNIFCNGVRAKSPVLASESSSQGDCSSPLTHSHVVEKQPEFVSLTQVQNESSDCDNCEGCEINPKPSQELSVQMDEEEIAEMDATASIRINVLPHEVAKQCFAGQLMEVKDIAATPEMNLEEADGNYPLKGYEVVEQINCPSNTIHPLKVMTHLVRGVGEKRQIGKCDFLKDKHQPSTTTSRLVDRFCNGPKRLALTESTSQIDCPGPPTVHPVIAEPSQMQFNEEISEIDCVLTDEGVRCETDPKSSQELPVQMDEVEIVEMDAAASIRINVLPQEVAKQCFAGQLMEDKDIAAPPEIINKTSLLYTPQDTISTKEQMHMWRLEEANGNCSSEGNLVAEQTNCQSNIIHPLKAMTHLVRPVGAKHQTGNCEILKNNHQLVNATSNMDDRFCHKAKCSVLTTGSTCQIDYTSPPKLYPVTTEPSKMQNEFNEEMPDIDYMLNDESMRYETDPKPSEVETNKMDALDSITINVLPHDMAELWFAGEMEVKDLQKDIDIHIATKDQVKVQVLELMSEKELLLEDVKPKEGKYQSSSGEKLESYCCLAKWFKTLEYGDGSFCTCQGKAEFREETKIEVHGTSLELQTEKEDPNELVKLNNSPLETTDDSETDDSETTDYSETTEDEVLSRIVRKGVKKNILKDISSSEEVCKMDTEIAEQTRDDSPSKCATNVTMKNEIEQETPTPDLKRKSNTICLALYGSSSVRKEVKLTKRSKGKESCEEPPETLQITILSHQNIKRKIKPTNCTGVEPQDEDVVEKRARLQKASFKDLALHSNLPSHPTSELSKNALSSTSIKKLLCPSANAKSGVRLGKGNKRKRLHKFSTQQMSMNKYVIRGKTAPSNIFHSAENVTKSKYELGNPALMPLEEGLSLEFKVLPESFNFEDGAELNCAQADTRPSTQNGMSGPEDKVKPMETSCLPTQGVWSFSPLKKKHTQPIQVTDVSGSCSLFQEFKKRYHKKKEMASK
ncbi:uncharacterized protein LOC143720973 [Siphateles boraxobius]|uniref:uncharacterized protein LOC143720973 n=1 Tax=Siphateles boraxobius TaxID=180520 RepID=UPI004063C504